MGTKLWPAAAGVEYVADWMLDDQPVEIATENGPVLSIPYTVETNDITMITVRQHQAGLDWYRAERPVA